MKTENIESAINLVRAESALYMAKEYLEKELTERRDNE
jgi:hypothetical protein